MEIRNAAIVSLINDLVDVELFVLDSGHPRPTELVHLIHRHAVPDLDTLHDAVSFVCWHLTNAERQRTLNAHEIQIREAAFRLSDALHDGVRMAHVLLAETADSDIFLRVPAPKEH